MQKNLISVLCIGAVAGLTGYMVRGLRFQPFRIFSLHKVFYPCNRCHLATLSDNQYVTCGNEVTRVTTSFYYFSVSPYLCVYQNTACGLRSPGLRVSKVPPPWVEAYLVDYQRYNMKGEG